MTKISRKFKIWEVSSTFTWRFWLTRVFECLGTNQIAEKVGVDLNVGILAADVKAR